MRAFVTICFIWLVVSASCKKDADLMQYEQRTTYYRNIDTSKVYDTSLTMATYNIQCGFVAGMDPWNTDDAGGTYAHVDSLAQYIRSTGADIVALQEVPLDRSNIVVKKLLDTLASRLHMNYAFGAHGYNDAYYSGYPIIGQWGVAILSKYPIREIESREVSYLDVWTRRSTLRARIALKKDVLVDVYSLHHKPMEDESDLKKTAAFVHGSQLPRIVAGDFNTGPQEPTAQLQLSMSQPDSLSGIDMIFSSPEFRMVRAGSGGGRLSDHECIWVTLKYLP
jgi:endonuclease/exonuclease/phosphatase family metal-dependent hydrolase